MHPFFQTPFGLLPAYTAFVAIGYFAAAGLTWALHRRRGFDFDTVFTLTLVAAVTALVGARAWHVLTHLDDYRDWFSRAPTAGMDATAGFVAAGATAVLLALYARPALRPLGPAFGSFAVLCAATIVGLFAARIRAAHAVVANDPFSTTEGGLAFFGGLAAAVPACSLAAWRRGLPFPLAADAVAPGLLAGCALGRIGCFLHGCCGGVAASGPLCPGGHVPAQLIEATLTAAFAAVLVFAAPPPRTGRTAALAALFYCAVRFALEFVREEPPFVASFTASQAAALAVALPAAAWLAARRPPAEPAAA